MDAIAAAGPHLSSEFLARVKRAYRLALDSGKRASGIWAGIDRRRADVHAALLTDDDQPLRAIFADPVCTDLFYGADNLCRNVTGDAEIADVTEDASADILAVGRAVGLYVADREVILDELDGKLSQRISFPNPFRGERGACTSRGLASYRAVQALYQTKRVLDLLGSSSRRSVVEIGPGLGRTAYYCYRAGLTDYTTIDIPLGLVAQACFLGAVLGPVCLWLPGDVETQSAGRIKLLFSRPNRRFAVALNVDSLVEMSPIEAAKYCRWIDANAEQFLSINRERRHLKVRWLAPIFMSRRIVRRQHYPLRERYFEDVLS